MYVIMLAVAARAQPVFRGAMPTDTRQPSPYDQAIAIGAALRSLRERVGMSQPQAGAAMGVTRQAWQQYETAGKPIVLRTDVQENLAAAIGLQREDLLRERDRLAGISAAAPGVREAPHAFEMPVLGKVRAGDEGPQLYDIGEAGGAVDLGWLFSANTRSLRVAGDAMTGYVESGQLVIYDVSQWPRRGDGCVVELKSGEVRVAEYQESGQGVLKVRQRLPEETVSFPMTEVKGVYLIRLRGI